MSGNRGNAGLGMGKKGYQTGFNSLGRTVKMFFSFYPRLAPAAIVCIIVTSIIGAIPSFFTQNIIAIIEKWYQSGDYEAAKPELVKYLSVLIILYVLALIRSLP